MRHVLLVVGFIFCGLLSADDQPISFQINEGLLGPAIKMFTEQANVAVELPEEFRRLKNGPVLGTFTPQEALVLMLRPTGLTFEKSDTNSYIIKLGDINETATVSAATLDLAYRATVGATATKTDSLLTEIPQAIQIVPRELMEDQVVKRLGDALSNMSSVQPLGSFLGAYEQFSVRGFSLNNLGNYFRDGRRYSNFVAPATEVLERVEVLKGPGSVLFGQAAPGGIVNFITMQPPRQRNLDFKLGGGQQGRRFMSLNYGDQIGNSEKLYLRLVGSVEDSDSFRDFVETDRRVLYGSLRYEISQAVSLTVHFDDLKSDVVADTGLLAVGDRVIDQPLNTSYNEPWARYDADNRNIGYRLTALLSPSWQIRHSFNAQRLNRVRVDAFPVLINEAQQFVARRARSRDQDFGNDFADAQLIGDVQTGNVRHTLMFGAEYVEDMNAARETRNLFLPISLFNPVHDTEKPEFTPRTGLSSEVVSTSLYFQDQMEIGESFDILLGLRLDDYEIESFTEVAPGGDKVSLFDADENALTGRIGAVWHATPFASIYGGYSEGFLPNLDARARPPVYLDPEESRQFEIGSKFTLLDSKLTLNMALFDLEKTNILQFDPATETSVLIGKQAHKGFELDSAGQLLPGWSVYGSYAWLDADIEDDPIREGNTSANAPEHSSNLWSSYTFQDGQLQGLRFSLGLRTVSSRFGDNEESFVLPGYERVDVGIGYNLQLFGGEMLLNAKLENLTDEKYFVGALRRNQVTPGSPRRFVATAQYRF